MNDNMNDNILKLKEEITKKCPNVFFSFLKEDFFEKLDSKYKIYLENKEDPLSKEIFKEAIKKDIFEKKDAEVFDFKKEAEIFLNNLEKIKESFNISEEKIEKTKNNIEKLYRVADSILICKKILYKKIMELL